MNQPVFRKEEMEGIRERISKRVLLLEKASMISETVVADWAEMGLLALLSSVKGEAREWKWSHAVTVVAEIAASHASSALFIWWHNVLGNALPADIAESIARGEKRIALACHPSHWHGFPTVEAAAGGVTAASYILTGSHRNVLFGKMATDILVSAGYRKKTGAGRTQKVDLFLVSKGEAGVQETDAATKGLKASGISHFSFHGCLARRLKSSQLNLPPGMSFADYYTLARGLGRVVDINNGLGAVAFMVRDTQKKHSLGKPLFKWQAVQFKLSDGDIKLRMLHDMAAYLAWVLDMGRTHTEWGLSTHHYALLLGAMYNRMGAQVQEDCLELGSGRAYLENHPAWRRYMDYLTLRLLQQHEELDNQLLADELFALEV